MLEVERLPDRVLANKPLGAISARGARQSTRRASLQAIEAGLSEGRVVPYLGPGVLTLAEQDCRLPSSSQALVAQLGESPGDRGTCTEAIGEAFRGDVPPTVLHNYLASLRALPLVVHDWYDDLPQKAFAVRSRWSAWGMVQGASRGDHFGLRYLHSDGTPARSRVTDLAETWSTLLYQPLGSVAPGARCSGLVGDLVETTGAIDGQSPIPEPVQNLSRDRHFLFLGCRLTEKSNRMFVRQILQRASAPHWAVLTEPPTASEASFMAEQNIEGIDLKLSDFVAALTELRQEEQAQLLLASW